MTPGRAIKYLRKRLKMAQRDVAAKAGLSATYLATKTTENRWSWTDLVKLGEILDADLAYVTRDGKILPLNHSEEFDAVENTLPAQYMALDTVPTGVNAVVWSQKRRWFTGRVMAPADGNPDVLIIGTEILPTGEYGQTWAVYYTFSLPDE